MAKEYFPTTDQFPTITVLVSAPDTLAGTLWRGTIPLAGLSLDGRAEQAAIISAVVAARFGGASVPADVSLRVLANAHGADYNANFDARQTPLGSIGFEIAFGAGFAGMADVPLSFTVAGCATDGPALDEVVLPTIAVNSTDLTLKDVQGGELPGGYAFEEVATGGGGVGGEGDAATLQGHPASHFALASHSHPAAAITDFNEAVQDAVAAALVAGSGQAITYDDASNTITFVNAAPLTAEGVQDIVGAMVAAGTGVSATYNDGAGTLTIAATGGSGGLTQEQVEDIVASLLVAGSNVALNYNDATGELTVTATGSSGDADTLQGFNGAHYKNADNHTDGATNKVFTSAEKTKLAGIAAGATANAKASDAEVVAGVENTKFITPAQAKLAAQTHATGGTELEGYMVSGAGYEDANGLYAPDGTTSNGEPVYRKDAGYWMEYAPFFEIYTWFIRTNTIDEYDRTLYNRDGSASGAPDAGFWVTTLSGSGIAPAPTVTDAGKIALADVAGLEDALNGKAATSHTHTIANITGLQTELDDLQNAIEAIDSGGGPAEPGQVPQGGQGTTLPLEMIPGGSMMPTVTWAIYSPASSLLANGDDGIANNGWTAAWNNSEGTATITAPESAAVAAGYQVSVNLEWESFIGSFEVVAGSAITVGMDDVTGLTDALNGKAPTSHTHAIANVTGLQAALDALASGGAEGYAVSGPGDAAFAGFYSITGSTYNGHPVYSKDASHHLWNAGGEMWFIGNPVGSDGSTGAYYFAIGSGGVIPLTGWDLTTLGEAAPPAPTLAYSPGNSIAIEDVTGLAGALGSLEDALDAKADAAAVKYAALCLPVSDEVTPLLNGVAKLTCRMPYAMTLSTVRASLGTASSSGLVTFDINQNGSSILSTKLSLDASEKTSTTAATPAVISNTALADDAEITIDIDAAGTGTAGAKVYLIGERI